MLKSKYDEFSIMKSHILYNSGIQYFTLSINNFVPLVVCNSRWRCCSLDFEIILFTHLVLALISLFSIIYTYYNMRHTLLNNDNSENFHQNSETCVCLRNNIIISTTREPNVSTRHDQSKRKDNVIKI